MTKKFLSVAVILALSAAYAQAETITTTVNKDKPFNTDGVEVQTANGLLTAPSITSTGMVKAYDGGVIKVTGDLSASIVQTGKLNEGGTINVGGKLTITGDNQAASFKNDYSSTISAGELHFVNSSIQINNNGHMELGALTGNAAVINNNGHGTLTITSMPTEIEQLTNVGTLKVGSAGQILKVQKSAVNGSLGQISAIDGTAIGLDVGEGFTNEKALTLSSLTAGTNIAVNADLNVLGHVKVKKGSLSVAEGQSLTVKGNLDVSGKPTPNGHSLQGFGGSINVSGNMAVYDGEISKRADITVGGTLTIHGPYLDFEADSSKFGVKDVVIDHQAGGLNSARLSLKGAGDYHLNSLTLKNSTGASERYNGIQLFNGNLTVNHMTVDKNAVGMINFVEGTKHEAKIGTLNVVETGTFHVASKNGTSDDSSLNNIIVDNANFANDTHVNRKEGFVGLSFKNLTAEGKLNIQDFGDKSTLNINNLHANGGAVTIDQPMQGTATVINIAEGASVAMNKGTTVDSLTVNMGTLAKDSFVVDSVGNNTKTSINIDGKLNNKDATLVLQELDSAVQLGKDDKGHFEYEIGEGDLFGAITGDSTGAYHQEKNEKLTGLGAVTALSALTLRHEMNSLTKRMGELRDAPAGVGAWARAYGSEMEYGDQSVKAKNNSVQVGSDYTLGDWKVGAAFTYTDGESSYDKGSADNKGYGVAIYGTWFVPCGAYVDLMAKYNRLDNDFALNGMNGSYDSSAYGVSAETGYRFNFMDGGVFVEPQVGLAYSRMTGERFLASNGVTIDQDDYDSFIGRFGVRTGFKFPKDKGTIYARVSGVYDFEGAMNATASKGTSTNKFEEDLGGSWLEMGVGANFNWTKNTYTYIDFERTNGGDVKENYRWNVGVRHNF